MPDADVRLWPAAFTPDEASLYFDELIAGIDWRQEEVLISASADPCPASSPGMEIRAPATRTPARRTIRCPGTGRSSGSGRG